MISLKVSLEECGMQPLIVLVGISQKKILTISYTKSVILGENIQKRYISL